MKELEGKLFQFKDTTYKGYLYFINEEAEKVYFIWNSPNWDQEAQLTAVKSYLTSGYLYEIQSL